MSRFLNDDKIIKKESRIAKKISKEDFEEKIIKVSNKLWHESYQLDFEESISNLFDEEFFNKDYDFYLNSENIFFKDEYEKNLIGKSLLGFKTLKNGVDIFGMVVFGDGGFPTYILLYYDGKNIRAYLPTYGNSLNFDFKTSIGNEGAIEVNFEQIIDNYKKLGLFQKGEYEDAYNELDLYFKVPWFNIYLRKYDLNTNTFTLNWEAIEKDILTNLSL